MPCGAPRRVWSFNDIGAPVLGISVDAPFSNGAFAEANSITFPLLSDVHRTTINDYSLAFENFVIEGYTVANRAVVMVEADGTVGYVWVCDSLGDEPNYDEIVAHCSQ